MGLFQMKDYYIRFIADKTSALAALKNGEVDMLDYNYQMQTDIPSVDASWGKVLNLNGVGRQEFGYNMQHPIFGTGVDTPVGKADASKAAEAARDVRVAFDYAIPRETNNQQPTFRLRRRQEPRQCYLHSPTMTAQ